jgi:hypothetical protein
MRASHLSKSRNVCMMRECVGVDRSAHASNTQKTSMTMIMVIVMIVMESVDALITTNYIQELNELPFFENKPCLHFPPKVMC